MLNGHLVYPLFETYVYMKPESKISLLVYPLFETYSMSFIWDSCKHKTPVYPLFESYVFIWDLRVHKHCVYEENSSVVVIIAFLSFELQPLAQKQLQLNLLNRLRYRGHPRSQTGEATVGSLPGEDTEQKAWEESESTQTAISVFPSPTSLPLCLRWSVTGSNCEAEWRKPKSPRRVRWRKPTLKMFPSLLQAPPTPPLARSVCLLLSQPSTSLSLQKNIFPIWKSMKFEDLIRVRKIDCEFEQP